MRYVIRELNFTDFTTEINYHGLREDFRIQSIEQPSLQELELLHSVTDFKIKELDVDDERGIVGEIYKYFLKDFLYPKVSRMAIYHYGEFQKNIDEKSIINSESLQNYSKIVINDYLKWFSVIEEAPHLDDEIKKRVLQQLERLIQDIENYIKHPFPYADGKLKFNWNKADVLYFFHLLRENKQIEYLSNTAYARIIDNLIEYSDGENFSPINDSRKRLSAYNQQTPPIVSESKKRLMNTFQNPDFYKE
ncbi:hypothetical protein DHD32_13255 [Arenibacter sp. TNZ]|uniref:hypothetical protein n=1 Tax=Arenibacter TaxID=178469 RepID=UPI000CD423FA|nr:MULTISPECIES: hypothetical protein [Arenibacter]MCM4172455.1 hypothetical protein [Arenibacter sp. TNZ]